MVDDPASKVVVLESDHTRLPSEEEVNEYASFLGIDVPNEPNLLWVAHEGVVAPIPAPWKACHNIVAENEEEIFYFNFETGESVWDHPCDEKYRQMVDDARAGLLKDPATLRSTAVASSARAESQASAANVAMLQECTGDRTPNFAQMDCEDPASFRSTAVASSARAENQGFAANVVTLQTCTVDRQPSSAQMDYEAALAEIKEGDDEDSKSSGSSVSKPASTPSLGSASAPGLGDCAGAASKSANLDSKEQSLKEDVEGPLAANDDLSSGHSRTSSSASITALSQSGLGPSSKDKLLLDPASPSSSQDSDAVANSVSLSSGGAAAAEAQRKRLQLITDEISDEESIPEDVPTAGDSSASDSKPEVPTCVASVPDGSNRIVPTGSIPVHSPAETDAAGHASAPNAGRGGGDAAAGGRRAGTEADDGAGGPRRAGASVQPVQVESSSSLENPTQSPDRGLAGVGIPFIRIASVDTPAADQPSQSPDRGLAGVGLVPAKTAIHDSAEAAANSGDVDSTDRINNSVPSSSSKLLRIPPDERQQAQLENSAQSGRSPFRCSSATSGASEISDDFLASEVEATSPRDLRSGGGGPRSDNTFDLSAPSDADGPTAAAFSAFSIKDVNQTQGIGKKDLETNQTAAANLDGKKNQETLRKPSLVEHREEQEPRSGQSTKVKKDQRSPSPSHIWTACGFQLESLARSVKMLKDIRQQQREYLKLVQAVLEEG